MKNTNKAFTLVELIVVITILAILGTIAFISLQGYSQDAKNAKVSQDLNTLASAIEVGLTDGTLNGVSDIVTGNRSGTNGVATTGTITVFTKNPSSSATGTLATSNYSVGTVDFTKLRQNGDDFKDPESNPYVAAIAYSGSTSYYQLAGQKKETSGNYTAVIKGNYIAQTNDTASLVSDKENTTPIINAEDLGAASADTDLY